METIAGNDQGGLNMRMTMEQAREQGRSREGVQTQVAVHNERVAYHTNRHEMDRRQDRIPGNFDARQLAQGLGWFSVALGLAEVAAPQWVAELVGVEVSRDSRALISVFAVREIATGLAILAQPENPLWVQARVGGDAVDLAMLGIAFGGAKNDQPKIGAAMAAVAGIAALDLFTSVQLAGR
jgi:hypothetical protein